MSMGICDSCLQRVYHARMEDGRRLLLDPDSGTIGYFLQESDTLKLLRIDHKGPDEYAMVRDVFAYKVFSYREHECPDPDLAKDPSRGELVGA